MKIIIGLGNPGSKYKRTRHNIGREIVESMTVALKSTVTLKKRLGCFLAECVYEGESFIAGFPDSFMNLSGGPVEKVVRHYGVDETKDLLVVLDDVAIPYGTFRLRAKGSAGGHNGLKSINACLGTPDYARLRIGIGASAQADLQTGVALEAYVLAKFSPGEKAEMPQVYEYGLKGCLAWVSCPVLEAMNSVNTFKI